MAREITASAIAVRTSGNGPEVLLLPQEDGRTTLPTAVLATGEIPKQTALRALREGAGIEADLRNVDNGFYKMTSQVFRKGIDKMRREAHFFKIRVTDESANGHGAWLSADAALEAMPPATREILAEALKKA